MKIYTDEGKEKHFAMFAKNGFGKSVLVASDDFNIENPCCMSEKMAEYVADEIGSVGIVYYVEDM